MATEDAALNHMVVKRGGKFYCLKCGVIWPCLVAAAKAVEAGVQSRRDPS